MLIGLMLLSSAAVTAGTAAYTGVKPDEFMKHWLILGPIPVSVEPSPDEDAQKKAFADDLLKPAAGESVVQPKAGRMVLFPAWVLHQVRPYKGKAERISVAFNLCL